MVGHGRAMEEYDTYVLFCDPSAPPNVIARQLEETAREARKVRWKRRALIAALVALLVWLTVFTALGAAIGWAFGGAGLRCENVEFSWYTDSQADCTTLLVLPQTGRENAQRTVACVARSVEDGSAIGASVEVLTATGAAVNSGFGLTWPAQLVHFEETPRAHSLSGSTLSLTGFGVRFQGQINTTLAVDGGVSSITLIGVSAYRRIGVSAYRRIGVSAYRRIGVSAYRRIGFRFPVSGLGNS
ncbi:hypothetical protein FVE85_9642 [Porphyridium purpureum]|uniref:Uncharacterized protein n=1 Tax=Porphyridium purpureum TaxID=35688 RepID=A0A5J4YKG1_PORPP|nr:hypothetical protein FVE85_9642 [Porphyridium purpureum]|eukprot:POR4376..scf246_12